MIPPPDASQLSHTPQTLHLGDSLVARARGVIDIEIEALEEVKRHLGQGFVKAIHLLEQCQGRVIVTGMGKSGLIGKKIAATLSSTGTPAYFLHPAEGIHGDSGVMMQQDMVIAISNSGETPEILGILPIIKRFGLLLIAMTGKPESTLGKRSEVVLDISVKQEACSLGLAPTASTTATLAMGDALAVVLLERKGFTEEDFASFHPAGALGKKLLLTVEDLLHTGEDLPIVPVDTPFMDALMEMTSKKLGMAIVVNDTGRVQGILTDGDVRRALQQCENPKEIILADVMTANPKTVDAEELAVTAMRLMETHKITVLLANTPDGKPYGVLHLHDLLKNGIN
ncbi:MAG: KpsF/GutQ family sugar-phosphate isomerase [Vampirovibrio sp.]|nr:KpsF/GutQ family sugar-phosphate isomerase [Vampirovibrio sp.]